MPGAGAVGELALHQVGHAERELDDLDAALDVALGVGNGLAVLAGEQLGELVIILRDQVEELHQYAGAALRVDRRPFRLGFERVLDRSAHVGGGGERHLADHRAVHRLVDVGRAARGARDMLAADEVTDLTHGVPPPKVCER